MSLFAFLPPECHRLAARHGAPCFLYRASVARRQLQLLRAALPPRVRIAYAVKANPHPSLLACFAREGLAFDCASLGELERLAAAGVAGERLLFAGPGKRDPEIDAAVARGVRIQAEGLEDLRRVDAAAHRLGRAPVALNLRVQPRGVEESAAILGGSGPTAFGVDEEDLEDVLAVARRLRGIEIRGLHGFAATNERNADRLLATHRRMMAIARRLHRHHGLTLDQVDLGGGLGVRYEISETPLDVAALGRGLARLLAEHSWFRGELILEPGRFLAAACGVYLARVVRTKVSRGESFAVLEGGIHHLLRPVLTGQPFPVRAIGGRGPARPVTLAGPLCTALDRLGRVSLPPLAPGDLLAFGMVGAYGATEAMVRFLDHPPAPEVWVEGTAATHGSNASTSARLRSRP